MFCHTHLTGYKENIRHLYQRTVQNGGKNPHFIEYKKGKVHITIIYHKIASGKLFYNQFMQFTSAKFSNLVLFVSN